MLNISEIRLAFENTTFGVKKNDGIPASVLVTIYGSDVRIVMTKKSTKLRIHAGQISFPGGKPEKKDIDLIDTAIRESQEELGLQVKREHILTHLDDVKTLGTGYVITPYVCILNECRKLKANDEVDHIYTPKLLELLKTRTEKTVHKIPDSVEFLIGDEIVWGASARILEQIRLLFKLNLHD
ncbi:MAG: NUDIX hydrolase [Cenarchaeum symbiont of Oopsacas minuta]|nr:NUDIX hydrolase [Cenarchaeum symbiont of Oopsacas minuta]